MKSQLRIILWTLFIALATLNVHAQTPLPNAHAHNDYEHDRPLLDALENGFTSVEADVWYIDGELYVYHDKPETPGPKRTLRNLYLQPLKERVDANDGFIYKGYEQPFYLMIDIKSNATLACRELMKNLLELRDIIHQVNNGIPEQGNPIHVFLSGNRPVDLILSASEQLMSLDGRPDELDRNIPAHLMPVVSDNYWKFSTWRGVKGQMKEEDRQKIKNLVEKAHAQGKKVRFWAIPDNELTWQTLLDLGVDLINTDKLPEFAAFTKAKH